MIEVSKLRLDVCFRYYEYFFVPVLFPTALVNAPQPYFAPLPISTTLAVSMMMVRSKSTERCLM